MIVASIDPATVISAIAMGLAAIIGAYATYIAKRSEGQSAGREETQQALDAQDRLLTRYEARIKSLEAKDAAMETRYEDCLAGNMQLREDHAECQRRLSDAEDRIRDLMGGQHGQHGAS